MPGLSDLDVFSEKLQTAFAPPTFFPENSSLFSLKITTKTCNIFFGSEISSPTYNHNVKLLKYFIAFIQKAVKL